MGLREKIENANSEQEIVDLLKQGEKFEFANESTKRSWKSTARFRLTQLSNQIPVQTPQVSSDQKKTQKQKVNKGKNKK